MASAPPYFRANLAVPPPPPPNTDNAATMPPPPPGDVAATLLVRHLPEAIPQEMLSRLFSHYGASFVRPCAGGRLRNCAFVDFKDAALAAQAQSQLNRLRFLGKVLTVERAGKLSLKETNQQSEGQHKENLSAQPASLSKDSSLNTKNLVASGEPIAARLGVDYPFPPHLERKKCGMQVASYAFVKNNAHEVVLLGSQSKYQYPPPDGNILTNIVNALIAVPQFYTQVLHLMNKMNIPAPFRMALPTPPLPPPVPAAPPPSPPPPPPITTKPHLADLSSDESEFESSEEESSDISRRKRAKREAIVGPAVDKSVPHEAVGLKPSSLVPKEVPVIKKKNPVLQIKIAPKPAQEDIAVDDSSAKEMMDPVKQHLEQKPYATQQEIENSKLPREEILSLPMFKNYAAGNPATVLYIKNLAKDVVVDDFYFIFGSLFGSVEAAKSGLNVKLMQEGRMRGQAFVTFPSIDLAHRALNLVNGYVFKGKPIIIQFGRNPAAGKAN